MPDLGRVNHLIISWQQQIPGVCGFDQPVSELIEANPVATQSEWGAALKLTVRLHQSAVIKLDPLSYKCHPVVTSVSSPHFNLLIFA